MSVRSLYTHPGRSRQTGNILPVRIARYAVGNSSGRRIRCVIKMTENLRANERIALDLIVFLFACIMMQSMEVTVNLANQYPVFKLYRAVLFGTA